MTKVEIIKHQIKNGAYDWKKAIISAANKIMNNPEVLLWR